MSVDGEEDAWETTESCQTLPDVQRSPHARPPWLDESAPLLMTTRAATITVLVPGMLRHYCGGAAELSTDATTMKAMLDELERQYPALHRSICDETGAVRRHVNLFVNKHHMRERNGLDTPLAGGDVVTILPAVSGG